MEENVVICHAVPGDEAMLAEIQAESWEVALPEFFRMKN